MIHPSHGIEDAPAGSHVRRLRGKHAILAAEELLRDFAIRTGQQPTMHALKLRLEHDFARRKTPQLFCVVAGQDVSAPLDIDSLLGCALFFEYRVGFWNTGFLATGDGGGLGTVLAPPERRAEMAAVVAQAALAHGRVVLACFRSDVLLSKQISLGVCGDGGIWSAKIRKVLDRLILCSEYDLTLKTLGKRTRTHMRSYRRKVELQTGCQFVSDAASQIAESELAGLNLSSLKPLNQHVFDLQFRAAARIPGGYVCGLRARDGKWLCLAGGWRQHGSTLLEWQMNASGYPRLSLSVAFRAFLIEHEISIGTHQVYVHGGTSHSISHAFQQDEVVDLIVRKKGFLVSFLVRLIPYFARKGAAIATRGNFLVDALRDEQIHWATTCQEALARAELASEGGGTTFTPKPQQPSSISTKLVYSNDSPLRPRTPGGP
jgi:hypothetical protein